MSIVQSMRGENVFAIIAEVRKQLRSAKIGYMADAMYKEVTSAESNALALKVLQKYETIATQVAENDQQMLAKDQHMLPAGKYILADPCTSLSESEYNELLLVALEETRWNESKFFRLSNGRLVWVLNTLHGDGRFTSSLHHSIGVDSGGIAVVTAPAENDHKHAKNDVLITHPFTCFSDEEGMLYFANITVNTGDEKCEECGMRYCECTDEDEYDSEDEE
jgi:hypothetical protein